MIFKINDDGVLEFLKENKTNCEICLFHTLYGGYLISFTCKNEV